MNDEWVDRWLAAFRVMRDGGLRMCPVCIGAGRLVVRRAWWRSRRAACPLCDGAGMVTVTHGQRDDAEVTR